MALAPNRIILTLLCLLSLQPPGPLPISHLPLIDAAHLTYHSGYLGQMGDPEELSSRVVETEYGKLRGVVIKSRGELPRDVEAFLGVPYASPPLASLRFMPPVTPSSWRGIKLANKFGPACPQIPPWGQSNASFQAYQRALEAIPDQSEDCLYLNIYVPFPPGKSSAFTAPKDQGLVPLLVVLAGGSWEWGSGSLIDASALASLTNSIVVTLNHRLGPLGFLKTSSGVSGNFGILDTVGALNFMRENARAFGGDPDRLTLLGSRVGAAIANFLLFEPLARGLFHRVILLSGSSISPWATSGPRDNPLIHNITQSLGCGFISQQKEDIGPCLRRLPLDQLMSAFNSPVFAAPSFSHSRLGPLRDNSVIRNPEGMEALMKKDPNFHQIPILLGLGDPEEYLNEYNPMDQERFDRLLRTFVQNTFDFHQNEIFSILRTEYDADPGEEEAEVVENYDYYGVPIKRKKVYTPEEMDKLRSAFSDILSDGLTAFPALKVARLHSNLNRNRTWLFHFTRSRSQPPAGVEDSFPHHKQNSRGGLYNDDLLDFSLGLPFLVPPQQFSGRNARLSKILIHFLANFINSGSPNRSPRGNTASIVPVFDELPHWDIYDPLNQKYLEIGREHNTIRIRERFRAHKSSIWFHLLPLINRAGAGGVSLEHHLFSTNQSDLNGDQYEPELTSSPQEIELYEGIVREYPKLPEIYADQEQNTPPNIPPPLNPKDIDLDGFGIEKSTSSPPEECPSPPEKVERSKGQVTSIPNGQEASSESFLNQIGIIYQTHGLAMGISIGIAGSLLLLNLIILIKILRQKKLISPSNGLALDALRKSSGRRRRSSQNSKASNGIYFCEVHSRTQSPFQFTQDRDGDYEDLKNSVSPEKEVEVDEEDSFEMPEESLAMLSDQRCAEFLTESIILRKQMEMDEMRTNNQKKYYPKDEIYC